ncbi:MAG: amidohydrolase [Coriobacteriia bacterium]|nr:amidohydrolase [Coriobacteriia bacterium]
MTVADSIFINGKIATLDDNNTFVQALAVKNGYIIARGTTEQIQKFQGEGTKVVDFGGKVVLPGIHDSHVHICDYSDNMRNTCDCSRGAATTLVQLREVLAKQAEKVGPGNWVRGAGCDDEMLEELAAEGRRLTRWDLAQACPNNPVVIIMWDGHTCVVNTKAMELAGITAETPNPVGGEIVRNAEGEPTGMLQEASALQLAFVGMPKASVEELKENLIAGQKFMNSMGYTSYTDCTCGPANTNREVGASGENSLKAYEELLNEGKLTARVNLGFYAGKNGIQSYEICKDVLDNFQMPTYSDPKWVTMDMFKIFADGVHMGYSAWMKEDYADRPGCHGRSTFLGPDATDEEQEAEIKKVVKLAHDRGWQIGVHAIGNKAAAVMVDAFVEAQQDNPREDPRHYLIHSDGLADREDMRRAVENGIGCSVQTQLASFAYEVTIDRVGKERGDMLMAQRDLTDMGMHLANGSDSIGGPYGVWTTAVQAECERKSLITNEYHRQDLAITVTEALKQFTREAAWQEHAEAWRGSIEVNKVADLTVLDKDIFQIPVDQISTIKAAMTIVDGKVVYEA